MSTEAARAFDAQYAAQLGIPRLNALQRWIAAAERKMAQLGLSYTSTSQQVATALNRPLRDVINGAVAGRDGVVAMQLDRFAAKNLTGWGPMTAYGPGPSTGTVIKSAASKAASSLGTLMVIQGADWLMEQSFGDVRELHSDGTPCDCGFIDPILGDRVPWGSAEYWSQDHFIVRDDGWFTDPEYGEFAWLLPEFEYNTEFLGSYTLNARVAVPAIPDFVFAHQWQWPPNDSGFAWSSSCELLKPYVVVGAGDPDYPLVPKFGVPYGSNLPAVGYCYFKGFYDQVTGAEITYPGSLGWRFQAAADGTERVYAYETEVAEAEAWAAGVLAAAEARLQYLTDEGLIVPEYGTDGAPAVDIPAPGASGFPGTLARPGGSVDASSSLVDIVESTVVPESVPVGVASDPSVDLDRDQWTVTVAPAVAGLQGALATRWPFAAVSAVVNMVRFEQTESDSMEWLLDVTPPYVGGTSGGSVQVWVRPLEWVEPFKPYRWVFVGGIALLVFAGFYELMKPRIGV